MRALVIYLLKKLVILSSFNGYNLTLNRIEKEDIMDKSTQILSEITVYMKYAKFLPNKNRRETWKELVTRNKKMHLKQYPDLKDEINKSYKFVYDTDKEYCEKVKLSILDDYNIINFKNWLKKKKEEKETITHYFHPLT